MRGTEWFCGVQLGGVKLPAGFPAARNSKSMVQAGTDRWRQENGRPMLIVGRWPAVYKKAVLKSSPAQINLFFFLIRWLFNFSALLLLLAFASFGCLILQFFFKHNMRNYARCYELMC